MNKYQGAIKRAFFALFSLGCVTNTFAGGIIAYEIGTPDLGLASAGYAARAQDAATAMTNPAGMTRLKQSEMLLGAQPLYGDISFTPNSDTTVNGNNGGNAVSWFPGGGAYFVYNISNDLKLGLSGYGNFGSVLDYDEDWVGRYYLEKATLLGLTLAPSIAYRLNDNLSVGAAFNAMYAILSNTAAVNNSPFGLLNTPDGEFKVQDNTWGYGATLGLLYEISPCTRFGFTYISQMKLNFEDSMQFKGILPVIVADGTFSEPIDLGMKVPQSAMLSFFHQLTQEWALLGNGGWQNWKRFGKVDVDIATANPRSVTVDLNYQDTWHGAIGAQYQPTKLWRFSLGTAYDTSFVSDEFRTPSLPLGAAWRFGFGAQYFMCDNFDLGFGYTLVWGGDLAMDQRRGLLTGRIAGEYEDTSVSYFGLNFHWKI